MNTQPAADHFPSFADTTVIELACVAQPQVWQPSQRQAARSARAPVASQHPREAVQKLPSSAARLLTLAVASLVVVPLSAMALVLARVGALA